METTPIFLCTADVTPKGEIMNRTRAQFGAVILIGIVLLWNQGCSAKLLKSESEGERGSANTGTNVPSLSEEHSRSDRTLPSISGENSNGDTKLPPLPEGSSDLDAKLPPLSEGSPSGELSGFTRNPS